MNNCNFKMAILPGACMVALLGLSQTALADVVHLDDVIITGSACVGFDCVNGENFGFDTIRIKENNLRIKADDTSTSGSFPSNDWQLTFNESDNGGLNKFSVEDVTNSRIPFTIEAGAPSNSIYVDSGGDVGFGTNSPVVDLHVKTGNTPTLRLEQDGSSGFTPQTWDVAGNEANFFIRDATNGSKLPLQIKPSAPTASIFVAADGDVGIGTSSPSQQLHISRSDASATTLLVQNTNATTQKAQVILKNNVEEWRLRSTESGTFAITSPNGPTGLQMDLDNNGNMTLLGELYTAGSCSGGCDLVFEPDRDLPSIESHAEKMWESKHLPAVGPTKEHGPFNVSRMTGGMLHELELAHIYIDQLHGRLAEKEKALGALTERLSALEATVARDIEAR